MKTPMQEVYENFNLMSDADFKAWMLNTDLLEKEKDVMCEFAEKYADYSWNISNQNRYMAPMSAEEYFNETFKTKEKWKQEK
jgi:hypothetical protein